MPEAQLQQLADQQLKPAGPWSLDRFISGPTIDSAVAIVTSTQGSKLKLSIKIDTSGGNLITGLRFEPFVD